MDTKTLPTEGMFQGESPLLTFAASSPVATGAERYLAQRFSDDPEYAKAYINERKRNWGHQGTVDFSW